MNCIVITTASGKYFIVRVSDGAITQYTGQKTPKFSGQWIVSGFRESKAFGKLGKLISVQEFVYSHAELSFGNGKERYFIQDIDHGTVRVWSDKLKAFSTLKIEE